jgi:hypothetical protein
MTHEVNYKHDVVSAFCDAVAENPTEVMQKTSFW